MSNSQHRVEDFLNPDFERYMSEKNVAVMLSHTSCSHEIAFPEDGGVGVDYASIETRGGIATGSRDVGPFAVCNCVDEMNFDELAGRGLRSPENRSKIQSTVLPNFLSTSKNVVFCRMGSPSTSKAVSSKCLPRRWTSRRKSP